MFQIVHTDSNMRMELVTVAAPEILLSSSLSGDESFNRYCNDLNRAVEKRDREGLLNQLNTVVSPQVVDMIMNRYDYHTKVEEDDNQPAELKTLSAALISRERARQDRVDAQSREDDALQSLEAAFEAQAEAFYRMFKDLPVWRYKIGDTVCNQSFTYDDARIYAGSGYPVFIYFPTLKEAR